MERGKFLRDCLMGIAISLVPKCLQPIDITEYYDCDKLVELNDEPELFHLKNRRGDHTYFIRKDHVEKMEQLKWKVFFTHDPYK